MDVTRRRKTSTEGPIIHFESGVQPPPPPSERPRIPRGAIVVAVGALAAVAQLLPVGTEAPPQPEAEVTDANPLPTTPAPELTDQDVGPDIDRTDGGPPRLVLRTGPDPRRSEFTLITLLQATFENEQSVHLVDQQGATHRLDNPVNFTTTAWPAWPGEPRRPFISAGDSIAYTSRGQVVLAGTRDSTEVTAGAGVTLLDGLTGDEFWVIGPGSRWASRQRAGTPNVEAERIDFQGIGRPLTAAGAGLLVVPPITAGLGPFALWEPGAALAPITAPNDARLLGATSGVVVLGRPDSLLVFDTASGRTSEVPFAEPVEMRWASLSPDGGHLAVAERRNLTEVGRLVVIDVATGETVAAFDGYVDGEFAWTESNILVTVLHDGIAYRLVELNPTTGERLTVATLSYPWVYIAPSG